jgi:hypothetical protein
MIALARAYDRLELLGNHGMVAWQGELNLRRDRLEKPSELLGMAKASSRR